MIGEQGWRELAGWERALIDRLLVSEFEGRDELQQQLQDCRVRIVDKYDDNYGSLEFDVQSGPLAKTESVVADGQAQDSDGIPIEVLLFVRDGKLHELEIYKADGTPIIRRPDAANLIVYRELPT